MHKLLEKPSCLECPFLAKSPFCKLKKEELAELQAKMKFYFYKKGQEIYKENESTRGVYCISNGDLKESKTGIAGKECIFRFATNGYLLGNIGLLSGEEYSCTATALKDTTVCFFPKEEILRLKAINREFSKELGRINALNTKATEQKHTNHSQKSAKGRIAETLLYIISVFGYEKDGKTINVRMNREDIGNYAGSNLSTTIKIMNELKTEGIIGLNNKMIQIMNINKLVSTAKTTLE